MAAIDAGWHRTRGGRERRRIAGRGQRSAEPMIPAAVTLHAVQHDDVARGSTGGGQSVTWIG